MATKEQLKTLFEEGRRLDVLLDVISIDITEKDEIIFIEVTCDIESHDTWTQEIIYVTRIRPDGSTSDGTNRLKYGPRDKP